MSVPPLDAFTPAERRLVKKLRTPAHVQAFLNELPYNTEPPPDPATLRSFRGVVRHGTAHCLESAITAAVVLEQHGYPPTVLSLESIDELDHVLYVYQSKGRWGAIARSRDPGLHGRKPVFRTLRALAQDYWDAYVDKTGAIKGYGFANLNALGNYNWRLSEGNVWKVERYLFEVPHRPIAVTPQRLARLRRRYHAFITANPGRKPLYYDRSAWTAIPQYFR